MSDYHEPTSELSADDRDLHRALTSLKEEIEAVDWYHQRVSTATDDALRAVLAHNRDEEIEHACMTLEWLRRRVPKWHQHLSHYLFSDGDLLDLEAGDGSHAHADDSDDGHGLGIGALSVPASPPGERTMSRNGRALGSAVHARGSSGMGAEDTSEPDAGAGAGSGEEIEA